MPPVLEGDLLFVIGIHDHGPPPPLKGPTKVFGLMTEQPFSPEGERMKGISLTSQYGRILDINPTRARAERWALFPAWTEWDPLPWSNAEREIPAFWYGTRTERRTEILNAITKRVALMEPPGFIAGEEKRVSLLSAKVTLLLHAYDGPAYEPFRIVEAASCGSLLISETPAECDGWEAGVDFVAADSDSLASTVERSIEAWGLSEPIRRKAHMKAAAFSPDRAAERLIELWRE